jgi:hypothetical protein
MPVGVTTLPEWRSRYAVAAVPGSTQQVDETLPNPAEPRRARQVGGTFPMNQVLLVQQNHR